MTRTAIALAALLSAAACQNNGVGRNNTAIGAGAGAAAGAALGTLAGGDDGRNAAIGAAIGAIAGGATGAYMDRQEEAMRKRTAGTGIEVAREGDQLQLTMPADVTFPASSAEIQPQFKPSLNEVATTLNDFPKTKIDVIGHASSDGADDYNMRLSQQRAGSVSAYLQGQGVAPLRVATTGRGENQPVASNDTQAGRQQNRRVELILTPVREG